MNYNQWQLVAKFQPAGDQPQAIEKLIDGLHKNYSKQVLLGVTGCGKTFTLANVIAQVQRPTIIIAHNKTLAAQLYGEMKSFFPHNSVEYFVSYYDYYQPEAYVPASNTYIEKDASINDHIEQMRLSATRAILERTDTIIVATVSAIYGLGEPEYYLNMVIILERQQKIAQRDLLLRLAELQYTRNDIELKRGTYRVRGDVIDIFPAESEDEVIRLEFFGDEIEKISYFDLLTNVTQRIVPKVVIYPKTHYVTPRQTVLDSIEKIKTELAERLDCLVKNDKLVEAQRLRERTQYDIEMLLEVGYCTGIENYSRHLSGRQIGAPPPTLMDYLPQNTLIVIDESHVTVPQIGAMYKGDRSRKETLVEYGFRLPSALDNRPLQFNEFEHLTHQTVYVSATPGMYEIQHSQQVVELLVRPTGLVDPEVIIRPVKNQVIDLLHEIYEQVAQHHRVLVTTLTKRMAEDLAEYLAEHEVKVRYLHADIDTVERVEILRDLRLGTFDVLVGINLLREGLDLPEVALVAILDADKEGFLRSTSSLIQTSGRSARNLHGKVIMYADKITQSMRKAIDEMDRRRQVQLAYNQQHNVVPTGIVKDIQDIMSGAYGNTFKNQDKNRNNGNKPFNYAERNPANKAFDSEFSVHDVAFMQQYSELSTKELKREIKKLERQMHKYAKNLEFEEAQKTKEQIELLRKIS